MLRTLGGYLLGLTALVVCPCHLPLTLPLVLAVLGGTSLGSLLSGHLEVLFLAAWVSFFAALAGAAWLLFHRPGPAPVTSHRDAAPSDGSLSCCTASPRGRDLAQPRG